MLRLGTRRRGVLAAVVDNRRGVQPVRVALRGDDPENSLGFSFSPEVLDVPPGGLAQATVTVRAPGAAGGRETSRPFSVAASDGQSEVAAAGSLIQAAPERRPVARVLFTLLGALAGTAMGDPRAYGLDAAAAAAFVALVWPRLFGRAEGGRTGPVATAVLAMVLTLVSAPFTPTGVEVLVGATAALAVGLRDRAVVPVVQDPEDVREGRR